MQHPQQSPTLKELRLHGTKSFPFAAYQTCMASKGMMVKHHWHDEIEMIYFSKGDFRLEINMEPFLIRSECLYFINPGELHSIVTEKNNTPMEQAIVFSPALLSFESYDTAQMQLIQPIQSGKMLFPRSLFPDHPSFRSIRDAFLEITNLCTLALSGQTLSAQAPDDPVLHDEIHANLLLTEQLPIYDLTSQLYIKSSLLRILAILSGSSLFQPTEKNYDKRVEEIKKVITYMMENYKEKIYIHDLAALVNMNEQYFCRFFKKAIGRSPIEYVNEYRIKQSMHLLRETNLPVTEICLECGFHNLGNFLKEFRRHTQTTPLKYRNKVKIT